MIDTVCPNNEKLISISWVQLDEMNRLLHRSESKWANNPDPDSVRRSDSFNPYGARLYQNVKFLLGYAQEHQNLLRNILVQGGLVGAIYPVATFSVIRPILEMSAVAYWLIASDDDKERSRRSVRRIAYDVLYSERNGTSGKQRGESFYLNGRGMPMEIPSMEELKKEAQRLGVDHKVLSRKFSVSEVLTDNAQQLGAAEGEHFKKVWGHMSGYQHGLSYAVVASSHCRSYKRVEGGSDVRLYLNDDVLMSAVTASVHMQCYAIKLLVNRSDSKSGAQDD